MAKADEVKLQNVDPEKVASVTREEKIRVARRRFLRQALAVTSGIALSELIPSQLVGASPQTTCTPGPTLVNIVPITSKDKKLQAVLKMLNTTRTVPTKTGNQQRMLRYFSGYNTTNPNEKWPTTPSAVSPGPTFRCEIGDSVQITLLNQVNAGAFQGSLYSGEKGTATGCDEVTKVGPTNPTDTNFYPSNDTFPNCFHASTAVNMHFHGTHVTPSTTGDNVLITVQPDANMTPDDEKRIQAWFQRDIFDKGEAVKTWNDMPKEWRDYQMGPWIDAWKKSRKDRGQDFSKGIIGVYDKTAAYTGPGANPNGHGLPANLQLWPKNDGAIKTNEWPQYYVGSYPICFRIPKDSPPFRMAQAPGTHWYHAHKHGSTSVNLFNGLAGAFIIADKSPTGYDGKLQSYYGGRLEEVVLVFQQLTDTINLMVGGNPTEPIVYVNGQLTPTVKMRPGQIKLWRMVNATVSAFLTGQFQACAGGTTLQCKQTAQDGVQFAQTNYTKQPLGNQGTNPINPAGGNVMAPANRIDLLVQAPTTKGLHVMQGQFGPNGGPTVPLLFIDVTDDPISPAMQFPPESAFPVQPPFLKDITPADVGNRKKEITYGSFTPTTGRKLTQWTINGVQFEDGVVNQKMTLNTAEEWKVSNSAGPKHPFHIHVNPFQITEIFDPNTMTSPLVLPQPYIWWDTFAIPKSKKDSTTGQITNGYFKMRSWFVDFLGLYVQHCHILAHEDRGMMQLVEVCQDANSPECGKHTNIRHH